MYLPEHFSNMWAGDRRPVKANNEFKMILSSPAKTRVLALLMFKNTWPTHDAVCQIPCDPFLLQLVFFPQCTSLFQLVFNVHVYMFSAQFSVELNHVLKLDWNEFSSVFWKVQHSHSRHQKTTSNLYRINLKGRLRVSNEWSLEGAMYINLW